MLVGTEKDLLTTEELHQVGPQHPSTLNILLGIRLTASAHLRQIHLRNDLPPPVAHRPPGRPHHARHAVGGLQALDLGAVAPVRRVHEYLEPAGLCVAGDAGDGGGCGQGPGGYGRECGVLEEACPEE